MKISLCIPMYNESAIIAETAKAVSDYMAANFTDYEVLFSNDGSLDGSDEIIRSLRLPNVFVVGYEQNQGKGCAVRTAMLAATGDVIMFTDADLAYGTDVIKQIYDIFAAAPTDIVIGSRNLHKDGYEGYTFVRKLASKAYIKILCIVGGLKLSDSQTGCKAYSKKAAKDIFSRCEVNGWAFDFESILWAQKLGYKFTEMPVKIINHRDSKINLLKDAVKMLRDLRRMKKRIKKAAI